MLVKEERKRKKKYINQKGRGNYAAVFKGGLTKSMTDNIKEKLQKDDTEKE